jgi:hypothetical protein
LISDTNCTVNHEVGVEKKASINTISEIIYVGFPVISVQEKTCQTSNAELCPILLHDSLSDEYPILKFITFYKRMLYRCHFYHVPEDGSCHGIPQQMQALCATQLPC